MRKLFHLLSRTLENGQDAVLVNVVASSGSTPRGAGACMLVTAEGRQYGTIGGGMVEYRSEQMAQQVLEERHSRLEYFVLSKNEVQDLGMICGGNAHVYFRYISASDGEVQKLTARVEEMFARGEQSWLIGEVTPGSEGGLYICGRDSGAFGMPIPEKLREKLGGRSGTIELDGRSFYCETLVRAGKVCIFGGGHVAQALVPVLSSVGFRCLVLEDRKEFADPALFPGVEETRLVDNERVLDFVDIGEDDYVVIMTRGHGFDQTVQAQVLKTSARYIGVIGSRKKTEKVFDNLRALGFDDADLARITTPIGLEIGAETPAEIAVSITAQLIAVRAGKGG